MKSSEIPIRLILVDTPREKTDFQLVTRRSVQNLHISTGTMEPQLERALDLSEYNITRAIDAYLNEGIIVDWVMQTVAGNLLIIGEQGEQLRIHDEIDLDEDVVLAGLEDIDLDGDSDIILQADSKGDGDFFYLKNQGDWKFE